jgi:hypothetical protein
MDRGFVIDASPRFLFEPRRDKHKPPPRNIPQGNVHSKTYIYSTTPNPQCSWLTYESFFNHEVVCNLELSFFCFSDYDTFHQFQHSNSELKTMCYSMPLKDLQVVTASNLTPQAFEQIRQAFFPDIDNVDTLKRIVHCPWRSQGVQVLDAIPREGKTVRMPYNFVANNMESLALGTRANPQGACEMRRLNKQWTMWQTASRSCVIRLDSVDSNEELGSDAQSSYPATVAEKPMRVLWNFLLQTEVISVNENPFDLRYMYDAQESTLPRCYSLKTGLYSIFAICRTLMRSCF